MSRIAKYPVELPKGVEATLAADALILHDLLVEAAPMSCQPSQAD